MKSDKILDAIGEIDDDLIARAKSPRAARIRSVSVFKRACVLAAALVLVLMGAVTALASTDNEVAYRVLYAVSPTLAQHLKPVNLSDEDNGIRLDMISAVIEGNTAFAYIALTDLTGDRIDETIDLYDSCHINIPSDCQGTCKLVSYDAQEKRATFLIEVSRTDGKAIDGEKVTFSLSKFLSHKKNVSADLTEYMANADMNPALRSDLVLCGWGAGEGYTNRQVEALGVMASDPEDALEITEGVRLTKIGFIDGKLRVQTEYPNRLNNDNHGFFRLINEAGDKIMPTLTTGYASTYGADSTRVDYHEAIFDVSPENAAHCRLLAEFVLSGMLTEGDWQITFPLEQAE